MNTTAKRPEGLPLDERLVGLTVSEGADKAVVIPQEQIVLSETFFDICRSNACGQFGRNHMCPPEVGDIHGLMDKVRSYPRAMVYQTISPLEDSYDWESMQAASKRHHQLGQRLRAVLSPLLPPDSLHLSCGGCGLCDTCAKIDDLPCHFPQDAMPSVESYGVDVYNTVKGTHLKYINGPNTVTFFGMICFHEA